MTELNIVRINHVKMLEKSISKGGALREMYDATLEAHKEDVDNLMTNEEAAKNAMKSKRRNRIPSIMLSWLIMPLYVIFRTLDMIFDAGIVSSKLGYEGTELGAKVGGSNHYILGRLSIPLAISLFLSAVTSVVECNAGTNELFVSHGVIQSTICCFPLYLGGFLLLKQLLGIPTVFAANKFGIVAEWASQRFTPTTAEEFQLGNVSTTYEQEEVLGGLIKERENLIADLKDAIENDLPYGSYDKKRKEKQFSVKALEKEERKTFGR